MVNFFPLCSSVSSVPLCLRPATCRACMERVMHFTSRIKHRDTEDTEEHRGRHGQFLPSVFLRVLRTSVFKTGNVQALDGEGFLDEGLLFQLVQAEAADRRARAFTPTRVADGVTGEHLAELPRHETPCAHVL